MGETVLKSIIEMVKEIPNVNNLETFERVWGITEKMIARFHARFGTQLDPCCDMFADCKELPGAAAEGCL